MIGRMNAFDLPLLLTEEGGEGRGEEALVFGSPLSPALSPLVPRGERVSDRVGTDTRLWPHFTDYQTKLVSFWLCLAGLLMGHHGLAADLPKVE